MKKIKKRRKVLREIFEWAVEIAKLLLIIIFGIFLAIGLFDGIKLINTPYTQPCNEYLEKEYNNNEVPVRCDGFWKQKEE